MTRPVIGTLATRVLIACANLLLVATTAHLLGLEDVGRIGLLVLAVTFVLLLNNVVGGTGLVYLEPRHGTRTLRWLAYSWAIVTAGVAYIVVGPLGLAPQGLELHVVGLAFVQSIAGIHLSLLLGRERYAACNGVQVLQAFLLLLGFVMLARDQATLLDYVHAAYFAHGAAALLSGLLLARGMASNSDPAHAFMDLFRQGVPAQAANVFQLLNYRLSYFLVQRFQSATALGLWSISTQLAESAWLAPKSLGTVLYARVSNTEGMEQQRDLTLSVLKIAVGMALLAVLVLMFLPAGVYHIAFGPEANGIGSLVQLLAPGLLAMAASQALSHYLSGSGRVYHNTIGSGIGLVVTLALGWQIVPSMGVRGAAITASAAYCASVIYQVVVFSHITHARLRHYLPSAQDLERMATLWRRFTGS